MSDLMWSGVEVILMWVLSCHAKVNDTVFDRSSLARSVLLREWQRKWDAADTGRFSHSILPRILL
jgi:hypothetical protein